MQAPDRAPPPPLLTLRADQIPLWLREQRRWALWLGEWMPEKGKWSKVPKHPAGYGLSTARADRWLSFDDALAAFHAQPGRFSGLGYLMTGEHGLVGLDIDNCRDPVSGVISADALDTVARLGGYAEVSPSGTGIRIFVWGAIPADWTNSGAKRETYGGHGKRFLTITGHRLPGAAEQITEAPAGVLEALAAQYAQKPVSAEVMELRQVPALVDELLLPDVGDLRLPESTQAALLTGRGLQRGDDRSKTLLLCAQDLLKAGLSPVEALSMLVDNDHTREVAMSKHGGGYDKAVRFLWVNSVTPAHKNVGDSVITVDDFDVIEAAPGDPAPLPPFRRDGKGVILGTIDNVLMALRRADYTGWKIGRDRFNDELMMAPANATREAPGWRLFGDDDYTRMREDFARRGWKEVGRELMRDCVALVGAEGAFDSAQVWLDSLPTWDGVARVASFMPRYLMTEDTPYTRAVGLYTWTAMAARLLVPGAKVDMVPIWLGGQGVRKSSAVCEMVPDVAQFVEINLESRDDNLARSLRGKLVGELGELRGLSGRDSEEIKAWITRQHEEWVPKYKEFTTKFPRRCVFIGTTNQQEFLVDPTGNRRWLPVRVAVTAPHIDVDGIGADRAQLWAEAAVLFKAGGVAWRDAEDLARGVHADHMVRDSWEESVSAWLDEVDPFTGDAPRSRDFLRVGEVLAGAVKVDPKSAGQREQKRMAALLSSMGYSRKKVRADGRVQWVYALA